MSMRANLLLFVEVLMNNLSIQDGKFIIPILGKIGTDCTKEEIENAESYCRNIFTELQEANEIGFSILFRYDEKTANMGVKNRGIVFNVNFLKKFTKDETAFIIGHEVAHILYKHIEKTHCLSDISSTVHKYILKKTGKPYQNVKTDFVFLDAINKRFEYEADLLGASLARKAGYEKEISALEKMNTGLVGFANALDEHPLLAERIKMLLEHPYPKYNRNEVIKEFLYLDDLSLRCHKEQIDYCDFCELYKVEQKYITEAHTNLIATDYFLRSRKYYIDDILSRQLFLDNLKEQRSYANALKDYEEKFNAVSDVAQIMLIRNEAQNILTKLREIQKDIHNNKKQSLFRFLKNIVGKKKGNEHEL